MRSIITDHNPRVGGSSPSSGISQSSCTSRVCGSSPLSNSHLSEDRINTPFTLPLYDKIVGATLGLSRIPGVPGGLEADP